MNLAFILVLNFFHNLLEDAHDERQALWSIYPATKLQHSLTMLVTYLLLGPRVPGDRGALVVEGGPRHVSCRLHQHSWPPHVVHVVVVDQLYVFTSKRLRQLFGLCCHY